jgi:hypothetical protein
MCDGLRFSGSGRRTNRAVRRAPEPRTTFRKASRIQLCNAVGGTNQSAIRRPAACWRLISGPSWASNRRSPTSTAPSATAWPRGTLPPLSMRLPGPPTMKRHNLRRRPAPRVPPTSAGFQSARPRHNRSRETGRRQRAGAVCASRDQRRSDAIPRADRLGAGACCPVREECRDAVSAERVERDLSIWHRQHAKAAPSGLCKHLVIEPERGGVLPQ